MNSVVKLETDGSVKANDEREFTRLVGGFGKDKPMFLFWSIAELLGQKTEEVRQNFERNEGSFEKSVDFIDLKEFDNVDDIVNILKSIGITHHKYGRAKRWLAFSFSGMMKLVKIATTKESWEIYDRFLEDYFQTKAENQVMKNTIENQIEEWKNQKALFIGLAVMEKDEVKQLELLKQMENASENIARLEKSLTREETVKQLQHKIHIADTVSNIKGYYDMGDFAKILGVSDLGRNNMFKWLRGKKILMSDNVPYQNYVKYFKVIPTFAKNGYKSNKTLLKPNGIEYIVKKLIEDGIVVTRSIDEIIAELEQIA